MPRKPTGDKASYHAMSVRLNDEDVALLKEIIARFEQAVPQAKWSRHQILQKAVRAGLPVVATDADKLLQAVGATDLDSEDSQ